MKTIKIALPIAAVMLLSGINIAEGRSMKRGVSENQFSFGQMMEILSPGVDWYYNWGNVPGSGYNNEVIDFSGFEFVPMCWNANYNKDKIKDYCQSHPEVKYLLGFNEPNFTQQANLTPTAAAESWPAVQSLAKELGLKIVAPAMNYSPNAPYQDPTKWMDEFVALVGDDAFDYVAIHNYGGLGVMKTLAGTFHEKYGKDVWVTEFCYWPDEGSSTSKVEPTSQIQSMVSTVEWLETTPWIYRYAWFKAVGAIENTATTSSPCYGLIVPKSGAGDRELSPQGKVYVYMSTFDSESYHSVGETFAATDYIASDKINLYPGSNEACPKPIEISQFNAGATVDYLVDIASDGDYRLQLTVSGEGEPNRFDPTLAIYSVKEDDTDGTCLATSNFTLSGDNDIYTKESFDIHLTAGKQKLRIKDGAPYTPSGIHISTVLISDASAVTELSANEEGIADVYSLQGIRLKRGVDKRDAMTGLPSGIYLVGGKKVIKR